MIKRLARRASSRFPSDAFHKALFFQFEQVGLY